MDKLIAGYQIAAATYNRKRRKLYAELQAVERRMQEVRDSDPCPEHAPTACRIISRSLRELRGEWDRITRRLMAIEGDDPDYELMGGK